LYSRLIISGRVCVCTDEEVKGKKKGK
jgi:hypothetical protein